VPLRFVVFTSDPQYLIFHSVDPFHKPEKIPKRNAMPGHLLLGIAFVFASSSLMAVRAEDSKESEMINAAYEAFRLETKRWR
jgi:hypothetical protein